MVQIKIYSPQGTMLGVLTLPDGTAERLVRAGGTRVSVYEPPKAMWSFQDSALEVSIKTLTIVRSAHAEDGFELHGMSLEEVEKLPNYAFAPSAAYFRSMVAD